MQKYPYWWYKKEIIYIKIRLNYNGAEQIFKIQTSGNYRIELYGASGGNSYYPRNKSLLSRIMVAG